MVPESEPATQTQQSEVATQPLATQPLATQPIAIQPLATQPVATQPLATQPVADVVGDSEDLNFLDEFNESFTEVIS